MRKSSEKETIKKIVERQNNRIMEMEQIIQKDNERVIQLLKLIKEGNNQLKKIFECEIEINNSDENEVINAKEKHQIVKPVTQCFIFWRRIVKSLPYIFISPIYGISNLLFSSFLALVLIFFTSFLLGFSSEFIRTASAITSLKSGLFWSIVPISDLVRDNILENYKRLPKGEMNEEGEDVEHKKDKENNPKCKILPPEVGLIGYAIQIFVVLALILIIKYGVAYYQYKKKRKKSINK